MARFNLLEQLEDEEVEDVVDEQIPVVSSEEDPRIASARAERDRDIGLTTIMEGLTGAGTALATQGRMKPDTGVFDSARKTAQSRVDEVGKDVASNRKAVMDFLRQRDADEWKQKNFKQRDRMIEAQTGKIAQENQDKQDKLAKGEEAQKESAKTVTQELGRALELVDAPGAAGFLASGKLAGLAKSLPVGPAADLDRLLETVKANIGFERLQAMRNASPTGGALGNVSEGERAALEATLGSIRPDMDTEMLRANLQRLSNQYQDIVHGKGNGPQRYKLPFDDAGRSTSPSSPETKKVNGMEYRKVKGGWERVK